MAVSFATFALSRLDKLVVYLEHGKLVSFKIIWSQITQEVYRNGYSTKFDG